MTIFWISVIGSSFLAFATKLFGASVPESWLSHPRVQRINNLIPIALLSALVAVNSLAEKSKLIVDNRTAGVAAAVAFLIAKAPFPIVVVGAAITSATLYRIF